MHIAQSWKVSLADDVLAYGGWRSAVTDAPALPQLKMAFHPHQVIDDISGPATVAIPDPSEAAGAKLLRSDLHEPVIWMVERMMAPRPAADHRKVQMPHRPNSEEIEQRVQFAAFCPSPVIGREGANGAVEEIGVTVAYPLWPVRIVPESPPAGTDVRVEREADEECGIRVQFVHH